MAGASGQSWVFNTDRGTLFDFPVYAVSDELVVAPEPASGALLVAGGVLLGLRRRSSNAS